MAQIKYDTELEMEQGIETITNFEDNEAKDIADFLKENSEKPIYIVGMGSSLLFPATNAKKRAYELLSNRKVEIGFPNNFVPEYIPENAFVFLNSNSGETIEILETADVLKNRGICFYAVTARKDSTLAKISQDKHILQGEFERGVAATKSIVDQALFYDAVIHHTAKKEFLIGKGKRLTEKVTGQMKLNFAKEVPLKILLKSLIADTYYWIDHNTGVAEELSLKSCEIAGKRGIYESGTQILHGRGEVIKPSDLIVVVGYDSYKYKDKIGLQKLADKTKANIIALEKNTDIENLEAETTKDYEGYSLLPQGWNLLRNIAYALERNIDHPEVAKKYRAE